MRRRLAPPATDQPRRGIGGSRSSAGRRAFGLGIALFVIVAPSVSSGVGCGPRTAFADTAADVVVDSVPSGHDGQVPFPPHIVALLASDRSGGDLVGGFSWTARPAVDGAGWSAEIIGEVEGTSLLDGIGSDTLSVAVYGSVLSSGSEPIGHFEQRHDLALATHETMLRATGLRVVHPLQLTSSPISVRLVIENPATNHFLLTTLELRAPVARADRLTLLPPLVPEVADAWLVVTPEGEQPAAGRITLNGQAYVPATRVVAKSGQPTELVVPAAGADHGMPIAARLVDRNGITRALPNVAVGDRLNKEGETPAMFSTRLAATNLSPDLYLLELILEENASPQQVLHAVPIAVTEESRDIVWTAAGIAAEKAVVADPRQLEARDIGSIGAQTAGLLLSGQQGGEVLGSLIWSLDPTGMTDDSCEIPFFVELEGASLLAGHSGSNLHLGVFAYVFSSDGDLAGHLAQGLTLDLRAYGERLRSSGLKFAGKFGLPAGSYVLHLLVRNQDTGRLTLKLAQIDVPGGERHTALLLPPVFPEPAGSWVLTRQHGQDAESIGLALGESRVVPAARAVVESGLPTELFIAVAGWPEDIPITARVVDIQGRHLAEPLLEVGDEVAVAANETRFFRATLGALDLPVGWYMLELTIDDAASGARRTRSIPIAVIVNRRPTVWASLSTAANSLSSTHPPPLQTHASAPTDEVIVATYLAALAVLAEGDRYASRDAVAVLERSVVSVGTNSAMANLSRIQKRIARELAGPDQDALIPIVLVHWELFRHYLASGEDRLADHAWRLAAALAEDLSRGPRGGRRPAFPETMLVAIAADLVRSGLASSAIELLERAVDLAPHDPGALLALGATHERLGDYPEAVSPLRTLVQADPDATEGRLRLAVNLARTGGPDEAASHFRQLIGVDAPAWIQVISYQELAGLVPTDAAEELLREGLARFPSNQALRIQLAHQLDIQGRPWEAGDLIDELASRARPPETSPRVRYQAWPSLGLEQRLADFEPTIENSRTALTTAIRARTPVPELS